MNKKELSCSLKCILSLSETTSEYLFINCNQGQSKWVQTYLGGKKMSLQHGTQQHRYVCTVIVCYFEHHSNKQTKQPLCGTLIKHENISIFWTGIKRI